MTPMVARTRAGLAAARATLSAPVTLVPTMGALHDGHRSLLRTARDYSGNAGSLVVSVFVNPLQFGPGEDLDRYPRTLERDVRICAEEGVSVVFAPDAAQMYPDREQQVTVDPGPAGRVLEGASRPGFFDGVLTVVLKLFNLVRPDAAAFGQKDAQQLFLVRKMAADLNLPVEVVAVPTARDPDGLATSSRNGYLSRADRVTALALSRALGAGAAASDGGPTAALAAARAILAEAAAADPPLVTDYLALADPLTFAEVGAGYSGDALLLVAAKVGGTRLIDNMALSIGGGR
jgi:pantoate--beta-alanine ligase